MTEPSSARLRTAVFLLAAGFIFFNLWGGSLEEWDESRTAERAREILVFNNWLTIHWNYEPNFVKPPLYYWLTALTYQVIGVSEFAARLWSALFGLLGFYAVYRLGTVLFSAQVGVLTAAVFLTIPHYIEYARIALLDTGLFSLGTLALCAFLTPAFLLGWTLLGLGFMLKGPWVLFFLLPLPLWWFTQRHHDVLKNPRLYLGAGLFLLIVLPWHLAQYYLHGQEFLNSYLGHEVVERIRQPLLKGRQWELLYYLKRIGDKWHVWTAWFLIGHAIVGWQGKEGKRLAFLDLWILTVLLILTLLKTQNAKYAFVIYPAVAVVVGYFIFSALEWLRWGKYALAASGAIALGVSLSHYDLALDFNPEIKAIGQIVQRQTMNSQSVISFRKLEAVVVFYCRRPVRFTWTPEEFLQALHDDSLVLLRKKDLATSTLEQKGFTFHPLYDGSEYSLLAVRHP